MLQIRAKPDARRGRGGRGPGGRVGRSRFPHKYLGVFSAAFVAAPGVVNRVDPSRAEKPVRAALGFFCGSASWAPSPGRSS